MPLGDATPAGLATYAETNSVIFSVAMLFGLKCYWVEIPQSKGKQMSCEERLLQSAHFIAPSKFYGDQFYFRYYYIIIHVDLQCAMHNDGFLAYWLKSKRLVCCQHFDL